MNQNFYNQTQTLRLSRNYIHPKNREHFTTSSMLQLEQQEKIENQANKTTDYNIHISKSWVARGDLLNFRAENYITIVVGY